MELLKGSHPKYLTKKEMYVRDTNFNFLVLFAKEKMFYNIDYRWSQAGTYPMAELWTSSRMKNI